MNKNLDRDMAESMGRCKNRDRAEDGTEYRAGTAGDIWSMVSPYRGRMQVDVIPATKRYMQSGNQFGKQHSLRVAAYCRVSTEEESQKNSYAVQKEHYKNMIQSREGWELAGIYADEAKSGTSRKGRMEFNRMMEDASAGKMDYIIAKSISRFARNTVDALDCVHQLQRLRPPVGVYFERENIDTLNSNSEMFLTFYCSMAQEESHSISENIRWSIQKNFKSGKPHINLERMLGYDMQEDGSWGINREQAEIVQMIFDWFLRGMSGNAIAKELNRQEKKTVNGKMWRSDSVYTVLRNEKYVGDLEMQKTITESFLTHKSIPNRGEMPKYYLRNHHVPIVSRKTWEMVQILLLKRGERGKQVCRQIETENGIMEIGTGTQEKGKRGAVRSAFDGIRCGICGEKMRRMTYNSTIQNNRLKKEFDEMHGVHRRLKKSTGKYKAKYSYTFSYAVWKCPNSAGKCGTDNTHRCCKAPVLTEISMEQSFTEMLYCIKQDYLTNKDHSEIMQMFRASYASLKKKEGSSGVMEQKLELLEMEMEELEKTCEEIYQKKNAATYAAGIFLGEERSIRSGYGTRGQMVYDRMLEEMVMRLEEKKKEYDALISERSAAQAMKQNFSAFLTAVSELPDENAAGECICIAKWKYAPEAETSEARDMPDASEKSGMQESQETPEVSETQEIPDFLEFPYYIFSDFILRITSYGDCVHYGTSFGMTLTSSGNSRSLSDFVGYRRVNEENKVEMITECCQIAKGKIQTHKKKRTRRRKTLAFRQQDTYNEGMPQVQQREENTP